MLATTQLSRLLLVTHAIVLAWVFCSYSVSSHASDNSKNNQSLDFAALDKQHQDFSRLMHIHLARLIKETLLNAKDPKTLSLYVKQSLQYERPIEATNLIIQHLPMLKNNYDNLVIFDFIKLLLDQNEMAAADKLFGILKNSGDRTLYSNAAFQYVRFYYKRRNWQKVLSLLDDTINDLGPREYHEALLIKGIAFQNTLRHRDSINVYAKVPDSSKVYLSARLNMATANIRQGWWTDAHTIINDVLTKELAGKTEEAINRFYLTLGYSYLYREYYRHSRDAFRNVGLKSSYTNRALLGLALTATNQEDYIGSLNAIRLLKNSNQHDLARDEAHLLMPYVYEKLGQHTTASSGYAEAVSYFDNRIQKITSVLKASNEQEQYSDYIDGETIIIDEMLIDLPVDFPEYILASYKLVELYEPILERLEDKRLFKQHKTLYTNYTNTVKSLIKQILEQRIRQLNSYKDQSRYGLARLYDSKATLGK